MKRYIFVIAAVISFAFILSSCGGVADKVIGTYAYDLPIYVTGEKDENAVPLHMSLTFKDDSSCSLTLDKNSFKEELSKDFISYLNARVTADVSEFNEEHTELEIRTWMSQTGYESVTAYYTEKLLSGTGYASIDEYGKALADEKYEKIISDYADIEIDKATYTLSGTSIKISDSNGNVTDAVYNTTNDNVKLGEYTFTRNK